MLGEKGIAFGCYSEDGVWGGFGGKKGERYQSAPWLMVSAQAAPRAAKSAERMEGAMMAWGGIFGDSQVVVER